MNIKFLIIVAALIGLIGAAPAKNNGNGQVQGGRGGQNQNGGRRHSGESNSDEDSGSFEGTRPGHHGGHKGDDTPCFFILASNETQVALAKIIINFNMTIADQIKAIDELILKESQEVQDEYKTYKDNLIASEGICKVKREAAGKNLRGNGREAFDKIIKVVYDINLSISQIEKQVITLFNGVKKQDKYLIEKILSPQFCNQGKKDKKKGGKKDHKKGGKHGHGKCGGKKTTPGSIFSTTTGPFFSTTVGPIVPTTPQLFTIDPVFISSTEGPVFETTTGPIFETTEGPVFETTTL
uniref:DUF148 domain-containing protein n=1 Tax=Rhabditophanes sp. KR3021 TaxID=114890 RepID=A0AC35TWJ5_9BILA